ncbi:hypothetical protein ACMFMF_002771 [Clarireedia jacksonii]
MPSCDLDTIFADLATDELEMLSEGQWRGSSCYKFHGDDSDKCLSNTFLRLLNCIVYCMAICPLWFFVSALMWRFPAFAFGKSKCLIVEPFCCILFSVNLMGGITQP